MQSGTCESTSLISSFSRKGVLRVRKLGSDRKFEVKSGTVGTPNKGTPNKGIFPYLTRNLENGK